VKRKTYSFGNIDDGCVLLGRGAAGFFRNKCPQFVEVNSGFVVLVSLIVEMTLSLLTEVTWMAVMKNN
jgi:hypothetical protein